MSADLHDLINVFQNLGYRAEVLKSGYFGEPAVDVRDERGAWLAEVGEHDGQFTVYGERKRGFVEHALARAGLSVRGRGFEIDRLAATHAGAKPSEDEYDLGEMSIGHFVTPSVYASDAEIIKTLVDGGFLGRRARPRDFTLDDKRATLAHNVDGFDIRWVCEARTGRPLLQLNGEEIFSTNR
jgi:hypothetical protein